MKDEDKNWISGMFNSITDGLSKVMGSVKKFGWKNGVISMLIIGLLYSLIINPIDIGKIVEKQLDERFKKEQIIQEERLEESIKKREDCNYFISELMLNILDKYSSVNRILLLEAHDNQKNLHGLDFVYSSCYYELINNNLKSPEYLYSELQRQPNLILLGENISQTLHHRDYLLFNDLKNQATNQIYLLKKLLETGDEQSLIFSFRDAKNRIIILLVISGKELQFDEIVGYISQFKGQIHNMLII